MSVIGGGLCTSYLVDQQFLDVKLFRNQALKQKKQMKARRQNEARHQKLFSEAWQVFGPRSAQ